MAVMPLTQPVLEPTQFGTQTSSTAQWVGFSSMSALAPWFVPVMDTLREYVDFERNWDGLGSPPIPATVIETTVALISRFARSLQSVPAPNVAPISGGALQIEFEVGNKAVEIEVLPDRSIELLIQSPGETYEGKGTEPLLNVEGLAKWLAVA